jgi:hypothetical protein
MLNKRVVRIKVTVNGTSITHRPVSSIVTIPHLFKPDLGMRRWRIRMRRRDSIDWWLFWSKPRIQSTTSCFCSSVGSRNLLHELRRFVIDRITVQVRESNCNHANKETQFINHPKSILPRLAFHNNKPSHRLFGHAS